MTQPRPLPLGLILFSLFVIVPICELTILVWLTFQTNFFVTLAIILTSALAGATLVRIQGLAVLQQLKTEAGGGRFPGDSILDGAMVLLAGGLMLTPGLITDIVGFLMLIPHTRRIFREGIKRLLKGRVHVAVGGFGPGMGGFPGRPHDRSPQDTGELPSGGDEEPPGFRDDSPFDRLKK